MTLRFQTSRLPTPPLLRRAALALAGLGCLAALPGCLPPPGAVTGATPLGPSVTAGGRVVRLTPPQGFCVDPESIRPGGAAAFALIEDCVLAASARDPATPAARDAMVDGLVSLSIGETRLFAKGLTDEGFIELERYLRSDRGKATAGMGGDPETIRILQTRRAGDTLYVLVEDKGDQVVPVLGARFWRAFTEVNRRAVIASLGVFETTDMRDGLKLAYLARVVTALKQGNGELPAEDELQVAAAAPLAAPMASPRPGGAPAPRPRTSREASGTVFAAAGTGPSPVEAAVATLGVEGAGDTGDEAVGDAEAPAAIEPPADAAAADLGDGVTQASLNAASAKRIEAAAAQVAPAADPVAVAGAAQGPMVRPDGGTRLAPARAPGAPKRPARSS